VTDFRSARIVIDLDAVAANVAGLAALVAPAAVLATVKADAYGHGAVPVARAALGAGATWLGVASVEECVELRAAGITAPVLGFAEPPVAAAATVVQAGLTPFVYSEAGIDALGAAAERAGTVLPVHLKVDTGMHRVGCRPEAAPVLAERVAAHGALRLEGIGTHLAAADGPDPTATEGQLDAFEVVLAAVTRAVGRPSVVHAANSAGAVAFPRARYDLVRLGISVYGVVPAPELVGRVDLRPVLALEAGVSFVKDLPAGARVSYGWRYELARPARIATVPVGYADGVPRALGTRGGEVLVGGRRCPIAGTVTMDQLMVDVGDADVAVGDPVVLIGRQGDEVILADEWATRLDTIPNEILTRFGGRLPRHHVGGTR